MGSKDQMKRSKVYLEDEKRCKECQFGEWMLSDAYLIACPNENMPFQIFKTNFQYFWQIFLCISNDIQFVTGLFYGNSLSHACVFACPHVNIPDRVFKISKLCFNATDKDYVAFTTMFKFLLAGFDPSFNFFFSILIWDKCLQASTLWFLTNFWRCFIPTTSLSCFPFNFSFFCKSLRL